MNKVEAQKALAADLLLFRVEGSFATAFLEAFIRADRENALLLSEVFEIFSEKFSWVEKSTAFRKRMFEAKE